MGELQCGSLDYVYRMTWAEFQLRLSSFNRQELRRGEEVRLQCFYSGFDLDPKKIKKPSDLWKIKGLDDKIKKNEPSESSKLAFKKAMDNYLKQKNGTT